MKFPLDKSHFITGDCKAQWKKEQQEEKDPDYKVFSDPSGSFLELAPYGITFSPGNGSTAMVLQKTGMVSLTGVSMNFTTNSNILIGKGKKGEVQNVYVEAEKTLQLSLTDGTSQITMEEDTDIISTFVRKDAKLKLFAKPYASTVQKELTAEDATNRANCNAQSKESLTNIANDYKEQLLEEKKEKAESKIRNGIFSVLTVVATVAVVVATGGAAAPLAIAIGATGAFKTASAVADIAEGISDLNKVEAGDISQSYNFMRDGLFGGNEALYEGAKAVNDMVFGFVTGKAISGNLAKLGDANKVVKLINNGKELCEKNKKLNMALNITGDVVTGCVNDYLETGTIDFKNVLINVGAGTLKGLALNKLQFGCNSKLFNSTLARKATNVAIGTSTGTLIDWGKSKLTGEPFNLTASLGQNFVTSGIGQLFGEPIDAVTGAFLITASDILLPDVMESVRLERKYRSTDRRKGWLGMGWRFAYEGKLLKDGELLHVQLPEGYTAAFLQTGEEYHDTIGNGRFRLSYDGITGRWKVTDGHKHKTYCYNEKGLLEAVTDRNGQTLVISYDGDCPEKMVTSLGYEVTFEFSDGKLKGMTDDTGRSIQYRYEDDLLTEVVHMDGGITHYAYSEQGYLTRPTDQTGLTYLTNEYDGQGRVVLQTLANGDTYTAVYHDKEKKVCVEYSTYPGWKEYYYDEQMAVREIRFPDGSRERFSYDAGNNRTLVEDRLGRKTHTEYDAGGHLVKEIRPEGLVTEYIYNETGDPVCVRDSGGRERVLTYDACHNIVCRQEKTAEGHYIEKTYDYDARGRLIRETDGEGHETLYRYEEDSAYPSLTAYSDGTELKCEYSRNGRKLSEDDGAVRWEYAYNQGGWRTMERDGEGNETHYLYDGMGRKLAMYTPIQWEKRDGKRTDYQYDFLERLIDTAYPDGSHEKLFRDGEGNILKKVHPNAYDERTKDGEGICYDYDGENRLLRIHYPDGGVERFFYDAVGNRIKHVLPEQYDEAADDGEGWTYTYDEGNRLTSVTGPDGVVENTYAYDAWGNCVQKTDEKGCNTYYEYDFKGRIIRILGAMGKDVSSINYHMLSYEYDNNDNCIKEVRYGGRYSADGELLTSGEDLTLTFTYDVKNRLIRVEDGLGAKISYRYDARGNKISEEQIIRNKEDFPGRKVLKKIKYTYDRAGRLTKKTEILDGGLPEDAQGTVAVTQHEYDANGNRTDTITPEGYRISHSYDDRDRLVTERVEDKVNGIESTTYIVYDREGNITSIKQRGKDGHKREITFDYDLKDRIIRTRELESPISEIFYDKNDRRREQRQLLPIEEERYISSVFGYDIRGNLIERYRNDILEEKKWYDFSGNCIQIRDGDDVEVNYQYGLCNEYLGIYTASSKKRGKASQKIVYDIKGGIIGIEDGNGSSTSYQLDSWGRIFAVNTAEGGQEQYAYDQAGNITETVDAKGGKIRYTYNSQGKVCAITDQIGNTETFRYDKEGRQIQHTDRRGTVTETRYNVYGQPVLQACTDTKGKRYIMGTWEYDDLGQLRKAVAGGFCYTYDFRSDGKLLKKWSSGRQVVSCTYYKNGDLKSLTDVSGKTLYYGYDENGRMASLRDGEGRLLTEYLYTAGGRLKEIKTQEGVCVVYSYDSDGNLSRLKIKNKEKDSTLYDAFMLYDLNGNRTKKTGERLRADGKLQKMNISYSYDRMNRLTEERREADGDRYSYDLTGNRIRKQHYSYALAEKSLNAQSAKGTISNNTFADNCDIIDWEEKYCYDERNELTERKVLSGITEYLYDENGSLVREKEGSKTASYQYDLLNRQTHVRTFEGREQENFYDGEGLRAGIKENGKISTFLFLNGEILAECDGNKEPVRRHLSGLGLSHVEDINTRILHTYHQDEQGSTAYITENNGEVENCYTYDAFGNVLESRESTRNRILYTGQQYDQEAGQYYLRTRYYNPVIGRFMKEDTYRGDGLNLYTYCKNNPVIYYDPSGLNTDCSNKKEQEEVPKTKTSEIDADALEQPIVEVEISKKKYPESARHIEAAIEEGRPDVLTIDRDHAKEHRKKSLKGIDTKPGMDRDEYPPAMFLEGGEGASVWLIPKSDNRGSGAAFGKALRGYDNGTKVRFVIVD